MQTRDILLVGECSAEWLATLEPYASPMGIHFISIASFNDGMEIIRQYTDVVDGVIVDLSSPGSSEHLASYVSKIRSVSPGIAVVCVAENNPDSFTPDPGLRTNQLTVSGTTDPHEILIQLGQLLGCDISGKASIVLPKVTAVRISELPASHNAGSNYAGEFAFTLDSCFVARNEMEEQMARSAAIRWHYDLLTMLTLVDCDIQLKLRFARSPNTTHQDHRISIWLTGHISAPTSTDARKKAESIAVQLGQFLGKEGSCSSDLYIFHPVQDGNQLTGYLFPFDPLTILEFRNMNISLSLEGTAGAGIHARDLHIASPAKVTHVRTLQKLIEVISHQSSAAMFEVILHPAKLTANEIEHLRLVRNNLWKQESSLTYPELQTAAIEIDELLFSGTHTFETKCRLWSGEEYVPEGLISTIAREYYLPLSEITRLPVTQISDACSDKEREVEGLRSMTSLSCAVDLFRLPLPTRVPLRGVLGTHPVMDYTPDHLPTAGPLLGYKSVSKNKTEVRISPDDLRRHAYILGQTGTGKSTVLRSMIMERIRSGMGLCLIEPHGDLFSSIYSHLSKRERERTVVFDPSDVVGVPGLNMLEYDPSHPEQKTLLVNEMINIFDMLYDLRQTGGPIFEQYMRNAMLLVMDDPVKQGTLVDVVRVFQESEHRNELVTQCKNVLVKAFWLEAIRTKGEAGLDYLSPYITSKLNQFISNDYIFPIISQRKSGLDFRQLIDSDTILLVKLSKGKLGEIGVKLLGMILFARLLLAGLSRDDIRESARRDFCLFVDEFQNFTSESVAQMLSEARKYRLNLVLANQTLGQLRTTILDSVLGNVGNLVFFRPGVNDFERIKPYIDPPFQREEVLNLPNHFALGKFLIHGVPHPPFVFETVRPSTKVVKEKHDCDTE